MRRARTGWLPFLFALLALAIAPWAHAAEEPLEPEMAFRQSVQVLPDG